MTFSGMLTTAPAFTEPDSGYGSTDAQVLATVLGIYAIVLGIALVLAAISYVVLAIGLSAVFRKVGIEPWKAWVPIYSNYTWLQLGGQNGHWVWASLIPYGGLVTSIFLYIGMHRTGKAFGKDTGFLVLGIFLPWVWVLMLGYGNDEYRPERIAAAGLGMPLIGYGSASSPVAYPQGAGVVPAPGYAPAAGYAPAPEHAPAPGYAPAPGHAPAPGYAPATGNAPAPGYPPASAVPPVPPVPQVPPVPPVPTVPPAPPGA